MTYGNTDTEFIIDLMTMHKNYDKYKLSQEEVNDMIHHVSTE